MKSVTEEMGAPLTKREKQAKSGIEDITAKAIEKAKLNVPSMAAMKLDALSKFYRSLCKMCTLQSSAAYGP